MRSLKQILAGCTAVLCAVVFVSSQGFATPISASMSLTAEAQIDGVTATNTSTDSWGVPLSTLNISASALALGTTGTSLTVAGGGSAIWGAGGNSGIVRFGGLGWTTAPNAAGAQDTSETAFLNKGGPDWTYTFRADGDGTFTMTYDVSGFGDKFGLNGWMIDWLGGPGGGLDLTNVSDPTISSATNGDFVRSLLSGHTYTVSLQNGANQVANDTTFPDGLMDGLFTFVITDPPAVVPEPGSIALLATGLAAFGAFRRRNKQ